jgi:hypothetical protein
VLVGVEHPVPDALLLRFDGSNCPWPEGKIELEIHDVEEEQIPEAALGDTWLYEEWDLPRDGAFELRVLMQRCEIRVVGRDVYKRIGAFPVRLLKKHSCDTNQGPVQTRVVLVDDVRSPEPAAWFLYGLPGDDDDDEAVIVRNLVLARRVRFCPLCGVAL